VRQGVNKRLAVDALFYIKEAGLLDLSGVYLKFKIQTKSQSI